MVNPEEGEADVGPPRPPSEEDPEIAAEEDVGPMLPPPVKRRKVRTHVHEMDAML